MRIFCFLLSAVAALASGCSVMITESGRSPAYDLSTREQVRAKYGEPVSSWREGNLVYEEFITRRKIPETWKSPNLLMANALTLGLSECLFFPQEAGLAVKRALLGQRILFYYEPDGPAFWVGYDGKTKQEREEEWNTRFDWLR